LYPQQAATIRAQRSSLLQTFRTYEGGIETAINRLLAQFRDANRSCRTTPAPAYFNSRWTLPYSMLDEAEVRKQSADPVEKVGDVTVALSELRELSRQVLAEYEQLIVRYPHASKVD
jgi:hypothetical protein